MWKLLGKNIDMEDTSREGVSSMRCFHLSWKESISLSQISILYSLDSKPPLESKPPVYNAFPMEKSFDENPISKVSPRAYYPDYTVSLLYFLELCMVDP